MIKAILFDSWGTIVENGVFPSPVKQVKYILRVDSPFDDFVMRFEKTMMLQKHPSLREAFVEVCKEFQVEPKDWIIDRLVGMWNKNMLLAKPFPETVEVLESLKKKHQMALVANTDQFSLEPVLEKYDLRKYFEVIALSYEMGQLKTDTKMFDYVFRKLKVKKTEAVMIGDSMQSDVNAAENAGIKAYLIDRKNVRDHEHKISNLKEIEKVLQ